MKRNYKIFVAFTKEEYELVKKKAAEMGLCASSYIRSLALNHRLVSVNEI